MDLLKKLFPFSFGVTDVVSLIIRIVIYIGVGAIVGFIISLVSWIPLVGLLAKLIGAVVELYVTVGIVLVVLKFLRVL